MDVPIVDLFAGPGGLGEGFTSYRGEGLISRFRLALSIEKDPHAHCTLQLRSFFRSLRDQEKTGDYDRYIRGDDHVDLDELFRRHPREATAAAAEAKRLTLGVETRDTASQLIRTALSEWPASPWILIGGPPCQAYSMAGRSKMRNLDRIKFERDELHTLYKEYLHILAAHRPHVFVMENVKGLLSSEHQSRRIFGQILSDLRGAAGKDSYILIPFAARDRQPFFPGTYPFEPLDFVIECERYGIPQARHRVIILGIRSDLLAQRPGCALRFLSPSPAMVPVGRVLPGLPALRSGLSREPDSAESWLGVIRSAVDSEWIGNLERETPAIAALVRDTAQRASAPPAGRGGRFLADTDVTVDYRPDWYLYSGLGGVSNHEARQHMASDLHRYLFAACYGVVRGESPKLVNFPPQLRPAHRNVESALGHGMFNDRFRVQVQHRPCTTIVSHISKDGHYYIHPDPGQCRSLTVREAARIQTFPDSYFFEGPRTEQYKQVGNAVPPLLAVQLAEIVAHYLEKLTSGSDLERSSQLEYVAYPRQGHGT